MFGLKRTYGNPKDDRTLSCDLCSIDVRVKHCMTLHSYDFPRWKLCLECDSRLKYFYGGIFDAEKATEQAEYEKLQLGQLHEANEQLRRENTELKEDVVELAHRIDG